MRREEFWSERTEMALKTERENLRKEHAENLEDVRKKRNEYFEKQAEALQKQHRTGFQRFDSDVSIAASALGMAWNSDTTTRPSSRLGELLQFVRSDISKLKEAPETGD
ncbi:uncharacterized protein EKO05_0010704 [Ascochyta rabiei]|nr:uncharacterized protein EKO05_0010704 [Ascochyta rabiei]UPX20474.1 hypothetical protein EKO05_0010704 [Ascochyta rabiei]